MSIQFILCISSLTDRSFDDIILCSINMEVDLQPVEKRKWYPDSQRAIFNVLRATLQYPANPEVKSARLVDDIKFFFRGVDEWNKRGILLDHLWRVIIETACCIPPGHSWQDSLLESLKSLRQQGGPYADNDKVRDTNSPVLSIYD